MTPAAFPRRLAAFGLSALLAGGLAGLGATPALGRAGAPTAVGPAGVPALVPADPATPSAAALAAESRIARLLPARLRDRALGPQVGVLVEDAASGRDIVGSRADRPFLPASNMKIVTAVSVLTRLGPDHRFTTSVVRGDGPKELIVVGGGDPLLTSADLRELARQTAAALRGTPLAGGPVVVRVDDDLFGPVSAAPGWRPDYQPYVVSPVRGLGRLGHYASDTGSAAARYLVAQLRGAGVVATYGGRDDAGGGAGALAIVSRHTVRDAVRLMLLESENNVAEVLFRQAALAAGAAPGWPGAAAATVDLLLRLGVPTAGVVVADGSGASRADRLTPVALTALLRLAVDPAHPELDPIYRERGLPVAGRTGTLRASLGRYDTAPSRCAAGKVAAKTGTLTGAIALSGVAQGADGRPKVFSFLVNDPPAAVPSLTTRRALDGLAATVTGCW